MTTEISSRRLTILMADDDDDDRLLVREALLEGRFDGVLHCVEDGEEIMEYLQQSGRYEGQVLPQPGLVLLDLNMPRKDGREVLREMKNDPHLRRIPVIVFSTSKAEEDIFRTYDLGVSSFITKPAAFGELVAIMRTLNEYWAKTVQLPEADN